MIQYQDIIIMIDRIVLQLYYIITILFRHHYDSAVILLFCYRDILLYDIKPLYCSPKK